jgi:glycosyltransferase involved in cell wall biosynthesis
LQSVGGEDTTVESEYNLMKSRGHEVKLLLFRNNIMGRGPLGKIKTAINSLYNFSSARLTRKTIKEFRPDVIHVHNFFFAASPSVLIAAKKMKIPVIVTLHNYRLICANCLLLRDNKICELCITHKFPWYGVKYKCYHDSAAESAVVGSIAALHKIIGTWNRKVDRYITPSEFSGKRLIDSSLNVPADKFAVKRNFIQDPGIGQLIRDDFYLFVGRISEEKGVQVMLDAWKEMPGKKLFVAGDGPDYERILSMARNRSNVNFLGRRDRMEILSLMKRCKALIFPSIWYEGLPLTIVEAFATGTPVIASSVGSMKEMIQHEKNGLLFETGNSKDLVDKVAAFEATEFNQFSEHARNSYLEKYHPDKCYEAVMNIYFDALGRGTHA